MYLNILFGAMLLVCGWVLGTYTKKDNVILVKAPVENVMSAVSYTSDLIFKEELSTKIKKKEVRSFVRNPSSKEDEKPAAINRNTIEAKTPRTIVKAFRVRLLAGYGFLGQNTVMETAQNFGVTSQKGAVYGAGLDYKVYKEYSVGVQYLSNQTFLGSIGLDF
jgi:hypothetical protein